MQDGDTRIKIWGAGAGGEEEGVPAVSRRLDAKAAGEGGDPRTAPEVLNAVRGRGRAIERTRARLLKSAGRGASVPARFKDSRSDLGGHCGCNVGHMARDPGSHQAFKATEGGRLVLAHIFRADAGERARAKSGKEFEPLDGPSLEPPIDSVLGSACPGPRVAAQGVLGGSNGDTSRRHFPAEELSILRRVQLEAGGCRRQTSCPSE